jgi:hypothetical protein
MGETITKHFVNLYSPGTIFAERNAAADPSWDVALACEMAGTVRHPPVTRGRAIPRSYHIIAVARRTR